MTQKYLFFFRWHLQSAADIGPERLFGAKISRVTHSEQMQIYKSVNFD